MLQNLSRRSFLQGLSVAGSALALPAQSYARLLGANSKLRLASVGVGGKGWSDLTGVAASEHVQVVALCDIDERPQFMGRAAEKYPSAKRFSDWRRVLDAEKTFDALTVSTPDHMHAPVTLPAMQLKKHVFCQKPLTHTVFEARQMRRAADKYGVVTQMGNQIQSHVAYRTAVQLVHDGVIGKVKSVHSWQSGALRWRLVDDRPAGEDPIPAGVQWDNWLGVAPVRPFKDNLYHSFNWRAWQDYSNGQLGDFGCHILDPVFNALLLKAPLSIRAEAPAINREVWTKWATVHYEFPGTQYTAGSTLKVVWYDGEGKQPPREALGLPESYKLPNSGSALLGEKGTLVIPHVAVPQLFPQEQFANVTLPDVGARDHYVQFADACRGEGKTTSHFDYAANLTETVLLGTIAIRLPGETLQWNAEKLSFANSTAANNLVTKPYRAGWDVKWI